MVLFIALVGVRIGEASHPGPHSTLDMPEYCDDVGDEEYDTCLDISSGLQGLAEDSSSVDADYPGPSGSILGQVGVSCRCLLTMGRRLDRQLQQSAWLQSIPRVPCLQL